MIIIAIGGLVLSTQQRVVGAYTVERVVAGLNQPTFMTQAPGDATSLYVVERSEGSATLGRIRKFDLQSQTLTTFLNLSGAVTSDGGLLAMNFHPNYQINGLFYVTSNVSGSNRLDEYKTISGTPQFQRRLLEYNNLANVYHTINQPFFRPGGNNNELFVTTGDGGTQADEASFNPALIESPTSVYGKVLKFDLNASFPTPATDATHAGIDVVALGLRNPYRASFDRSTGDFYLGDVGFNAVEEVDFIPNSHFANPAAPPLDFGWTSREGTIATNGGSAGGPGSPGDIKPIFEYTHGSNITVDHISAFFGRSITGGYVYRGAVPELQGRYFFSDFVNGRVFSGVFNAATSPGAYNGDNFTNVVEHTTAFEAAIGGGANIQFLTSFAEDNAGNLYMVKFGNSFFPALGLGEIFRITPGSSLDVVVNRTTGAITLTNNSGAAVALKSLTISSTSGAIGTGQLTPITGNYDSSGNGSIDNNNVWTISSNTTALFNESSAGDPGTLGIGQQIVLSPAGGWIKSPTEDLAISLLNGANTVVNTSVSYSGNSGAAFARSDLDFNGVINAADWALFQTNAGVNLSGLSKAQSYGQGDLDGDADNDYSDFRLFKTDYITANGAAAFAALSVSVPEPGGVILVGLGLFFCYANRLSRRPARRGKAITF